MIVVEWNRRFTKRLGDAAYNSVTFRARIRLSIPLWPRASDQDRRETVIHEACHLIAFYKFGQVAAPHGTGWKQAMRNCGIRPLRTHRVDRSGLTDATAVLSSSTVLIRHWRRNVVAQPREFNLLRRGKEFWCRNCGLHLTKPCPIIRPCSLCVAEKGYSAFWRKSLQINRLHKSRS